MQASYAARGLASLRPHLGALAVLLAGALAVASPADAETAWRPFKALKVIVSDEVDTDGMIYFARGHFLVEPSGTDSYYLLTPKSYSVHRIAQDAVGTSGDVPAVDVQNKASFDDLGVFSKDDGTFKWTDGGVRYALAAKPPLIGAVTLAELRDHTDKYELDIQDYTPNRAAVVRFEAVTEPTEFVVSFGVWCPVCAHWLPRFIKTMESVKNDAFTVTYVALNEGLDEPADLMEEYALDGVPIFSVRRGGKELGRITGEELEDDPDRILEQELADLMGAK